MAAVESKGCPRCKQTLPATSFAKASRRKTGLRPYCRTCESNLLKDRIERDCEAYRAQCRERSRKYRRNHPDKIRAANQEYRTNNPDKIREHRAAAKPLRISYKARRKSREAGGISGVETRAWFNAQKMRCHWCGTTSAACYEVDHIIALSRGGLHEIRNLCIACKPCNRRKHAKDPIEFARELGKLL